jgi:hypothetical protein
VIWLNYLYLEKCASDLVDLPVPVIWKRICLSVDSMPVIWQNPLYVEERASDFLAELPVPVIWHKCLSVDSVPVIGIIPVCGGVCQ